MKPHLLSPYIIKREFLDLVERGTVVPVHMCTVECRIGDSFGEQMVILFTDFSWSRQTTHIPLIALTYSLNEFSDFYLAPIVEVHCQR
jgi:hypothetical protein